MTPQPDAFDREVIEQYRSVIGDDGALDMVRLFLRTLPERRLELENAAEGDDLERVRRTGHAIKGMAAAGGGSPSVSTALWGALFSLGLAQEARPVPAFLAAGPAGPYGFAGADQLSHAAAFAPAAVRRSTSRACKARSQGTFCGWPSSSCETSSR